MLDVTSVDDGNHSGGSDSPDLREFIDALKKAKSDAIAALDAVSFAMCRVPCRQLNLLGPDTKGIFGDPAEECQRTVARIQQ